MASSFERIMKDMAEMEGFKGSVREYLKYYVDKYKTYKDAASKLGFDRATIERWSKKWGIESHAENRKSKIAKIIKERGMTKEEFINMIVNSKVSVNKWASILGITGSSLSAFLRKNGVRCSKRYAKPTNDKRPVFMAFLKYLRQKKCLQDLDDIILYLYRQKYLYKWSYNQIIKRIYGTSHGLNKITFISFFKKLNVKERGRLLWLKAIGIDKEEKELREKLQKNLMV